MLRFASICLVAVSVASAAQAAPCDRACLKTTLDQYLNAVVQHNPSAAPLSIGFRQTENANVRRPGTGEWQNAKALGKLQRRYFDPVSEQAGYFGTFDDNAGTAIVTVSVSVDGTTAAVPTWLPAASFHTGAAKPWTSSRSLHGSVA